jgi:hypothetical protein
MTVMLVRPDDPANGGMMRQDLRRFLSISVVQRRRGGTFFGHGRH